jgi:predicted RNA-binding protein Jag
MDYIEKEGLSVPEAVFSACMSLGIDEKEAQVQVLSAPGARRVKVRVGKPGVALPPASPGADAPPAQRHESGGMNAAATAPAASLSRPAEYRPKVSLRKQPSPAQAEAARADFEILLEKMGTPSKVEIKEHAGNIIFNITGDKEGLLIGKRGATLDALQDVLNAMLEASSGDRDLFGVADVADYRIRQERKIMDRARELAELVLKDGAQQTLGPLSPAERRVVHLELKPIEGIETFSVGNGSMKKVVIQKKA